MDTALGRARSGIVPCRETGRNVGLGRGARGLLDRRVIGGVHHGESTGALAGRVANHTALVACPLATIVHLTDVLSTQVLAVVLPSSRPRHEHVVDLDEAEMCCEALDGIGVLCLVVHVLDFDEVEMALVRRDVAGVALLVVDRFVVVVHVALLVALFICTTVVVVDVGGDLFVADLLDLDVGRAVPLPVLRVAGVEAWLKVDAVGSLEGSLVGAATQILRRDADEVWVGVHAPTIDRSVLVERQVGNRATHCQIFGVAVAAPVEHTTELEHLVPSFALHSGPVDLSTTGRDGFECLQGDTCHFPISSGVGGC